MDNTYFWYIIISSDTLLDYDAKIKKKLSWAKKKWLDTFHKII